MSFNIKKNTFISYKQYKGFVLPSIIIFICIFLFFYIIFPQIQELISMKTEENVIKDKIGILRNNKNLLSSIDELTLENQYNTASEALPAEKDFVAILNAISLASSETGVKLDDFSFQIGDLSGLANRQSSQISIVLNVHTDTQGAKRFVSKLESLVPLSEITNLQINNNLTNLTVFFYYRPMASKTFNYSSPITPISKIEKSALDKISSWKQSLPETQNTSTSSAF